MTPEEATHRALSGGYRKPYAARIDRDDSIVEHYCVPPRCDEGPGRAYAPARRVLEMVFSNRDAGHPDPDAIIRYLCTETGYQPPVKIDETCDPTDVAVLAAATKEYAEILATWSAALMNGLTLSELEAFQRELRDVMSVITKWDRGVHREIVLLEDAAHCERKGPNRARSPFYAMRLRSLTA